MAGTERVASTWTGDNLTDFRDLRFNHYQAMTMALSGFLFFGPDVGGFAGPKPGRELFLRWLQYGLFLPRFVLHSWKPGEAPTMPWLYEDLLPTVRRFFALRERLVPYLYAQAEACRLAHEPLIRPVFLLDPAYDPESDAFLCGEPPSPADSDRMLRRIDKKIFFRETVPDDPPHLRIAADAQKPRDHPCSVPAVGLSAVEIQHP